MQVEWFRKPLLKSPFKSNHRLHRKICIVDGRIGFTGGVGIAEEWCGDARNEHEWRDTHLRVEGPAVDGLQSAFIQDWAETGRPLFDDDDASPSSRRRGTSTVQVVRGCASLGWDDMQSVFRVMLARRRTAAHRDRLLRSRTTTSSTCARRRPAASRSTSCCPDRTPTSGSASSPASDLRPLVEGGVRIWAFQPSMLHAKVMTVDGIASVVGSANMNRRSMDHDEEVVLIALDRELAASRGRLRRRLLALRAHRPAAGRTGRRASGRGGAITPDPRWLCRPGRPDVQAPRTTVHVRLGHGPASSPSELTPTARPRP